MKNFKKISIFCFLSIITSLLLAGCSALSRVNPAPTQQATRDPVLEKTIVTQLQAMNPDAVTPYEEATIALDAKDYQKSKDLYNQVLGLAPDFATAYRRLGYIEGISNNLAGSIELNRKAVALEPDGYNQSALAWALLSNDVASDRQEAFDLASSAVKLIPEDESAITTWLVAAASMNNEIIARQADEKLLQVAPSSLIAHYYAGYLAALDGKWENAESELLLAQKLGMPEQAIQEMLSSGISQNALRIRLLRGGGIATGVWLLGLGIFFVVGRSLSSVTLKAINNRQPNLEPQIQPRELRIRTIYRRLISLLSVYYYISIPFVILLLLVLIALAVYIFGQIGSIPVQVIYILAIMLFGSLYAILRPLLSRVKDVPPGRTLQRMDAPDLWRLVEGVAQTVSVKPVDTIYLTPGIDIAVSEKGSILKKLRGAGKRNLLLGMGVLPGLSQGQLAAILAHEYGHFSNRDTAGGNLAFQVHSSLYATIQGLVKSKAAYFFNPVWLFVVTYQRLFLRVTQGASRLQEILADRYAARAYGSTNFIEGLRNLIRQGIAFPIRANYEIRNTPGKGQSIVNFYTLAMPEDLSKEVDKQYEAVMQRTTTEYDSHPAPKERIGWIEELHVPYSPMQDNPTPALHLFPNAEELQRELTEQIKRNLKK